MTDLFDTLGEDGSLLSMAQCAQRIMDHVEEVQNWNDDRRLLTVRCHAEVIRDDALALARTPAPEGEVVAWRYRQRSGTGGWSLSLYDISDWPNLICEPLYASPVVPVSREEIAATAVLREVLDWIDNWLPAFIQDNEWAATRAKTDAILAALGAKGADHD
jgi:hypothetical protein